jgi:hypothetical protein
MLVFHRQACFNSAVTSSEIIDRLGGTVAVASICEVKPQAVSQWREKGIPKAREMYLRLRFPEAFQDRRKTARA